MQILHHKNRFLPRLLLAAVLFAQGVLAAHACVEPNAGAVKILSSAQSDENMPCHAASKISANECLMHCTQSDQVTLDHQVMTALPVSDMTLLVVLPPLKYMLPSSDYTPPVLNTGPTLAIRYCTFRI